MTYRAYRVYSHIKGSISQVPFCDAFSGKFCMAGGGSKSFGTQNNLSENNFLPESYADDVRSQTGSVGI
jgi:hypothetical protein